MPAILRTPEEVDVSMTAPATEALKQQRPLPDGVLRIVATGTKGDAPAAVASSRWMMDPCRTTSPMTAENPWTLALGAPLGVQEGSYVSTREPRKRHLDWLIWGLHPASVEHHGTAPRPIHARAETVAAHPMFGDAFRHRRAIVPASAYFQRATRGERAGVASRSGAGTGSPSRSPARGRHT
jgi:SOS response associated peptidase (SRAP)